MKPFQTCLLSIAALSVVSACSGTKETLGLGRKTPDEFAVVKRAPLEIPQNLHSLPTPNIGAPRPQEDTVEQTAQKALFGQELAVKNAPASNTQIEQTILARSGAENANENIRQIIDEETELYAEEEQAVIDKILKRKVSVPGSTLDAREELKRLKEQNIPTPNVPDAPQ